MYLEKKDNNRCRNWRRKESIKAKMKAFNILFSTEYFFNISNNSDFRVKCLNRASRYRNNMTLCSCSMCGNPRKYSNQITLQERKANDIFKTQDF